MTQTMPDFRLLSAHVAALGELLRDWREACEAKNDAQLVTLLPYIEARLILVVNAASQAALPAQST